MIGRLPKNKLYVNDNFADIYSSERLKGYDSNSDAFVSCMVDKGYHNFYKNAVKAKAAYLEDESGKIIARCVIFTEVYDDDGGVWRYAERQYSVGSNDVYKQALVDALIQAGEIDCFKKIGASCQDCHAIVDIHGNSLASKKFSIDCDLDWDDSLSYQDTFKSYSMYHRTAYNDEDASDYDLAITAGTTYVIEYETTRLNNTYSTDTYIKLCDTSNSGRNADVSALVTQDSVVIADCAVRTASYTAGTGAIGGYTASEKRTYIQETIKPLIPQEVLAAIKPVTKYTQNNAVNNVTSTEDVWIPSRREMFASTESQGPTYTSFFSSNDSRIKKKTGASSASWWWLRSAYDYNSFYYVIASGAWNYTNASSTYGVVVGFCT